MDPDPDPQRSKESIAICCPPDVIILLTLLLPGHSFSNVPGLNSLFFCELGNNLLHGFML